MIFGITLGQQRQIVNASSKVGVKSDPQSGIVLAAFKSQPVVTNDAGRFQLEGFLQVLNFLDYGPVSLR